VSSWRDRAQRRIAELTRDLPDSATVAERRKALWGKGYPAHQGTVWGRRMWGDECRKYLGRHGDTRNQAAAPLFAWPDDIAFPWKGENHG